MPSTLDRLLQELEALNVTDLGVSTILDLARQMKYDGSVVVHFRAGMPRVIELGRPIRVELNGADVLVTMDEAPRTFGVGLDNPG